MEARSRIILLSALVFFVAIFALFAEDTDCDEPVASFSYMGFVYEIEDDHAILAGQETSFIVDDPFVVPDVVPYEDNDLPVTKIKEGAFKQNYNLQGTLKLGRNIQFVHKDAFSECKNLKEVIVYGETDVEVIIDKSAFYCCTSLESITVKNCILMTGDNCFSGCTSLIYVNIDTVERLGSMTFQYCSSLLRFDSTVFQITQYAFQDCSSLYEVNIAGTVLIGEYAFVGCTSLVTFNCEDLLSMHNLSIGMGAFKGCISLKNVSALFYRLHRYCFEDCESLESFDFDSVYSYSTKEDEVDGEIPEGCFKGCKSLKQVDVTGIERITGVGREAFEDCTGLESVTLPYIKYMEANAFKHCEKLKSFTGPDETKITMFTSVFEGCKSLETVNAHFGELGDYGFCGCESLKSLVIDTGIHIIPIYCFSGCIKLSSVEKDEGFLTIMEGAFMGCTGLEKVSVSNTGLTLWESSFDGCESLSDIGDLVNGLNEVPEYCFRNTALTSITFTKKVDIREGAFTGCESLERINGLSNIKIIEAEAFSGCYKLEHILDSNESFSDGIQIGENAFYGCRCLAKTQIAFATGNHTVGDNAFDIGNGLIINVFCISHEGEKTLKNARGETYFNYIGQKESIEYEFCPATGILKIRGEGDLSFTKEEAPWCDSEDFDYLYVLELGDKITSVGDGLFANSHLTGLLYIPDSVKKIGKSAFKNSNFVSICIGTGLETVGEYAFYGCEKITGHLEFKNIYAIEQSAFYGCTSITGLTINGNNVVVGDYSFSGCESMRNIVIGEGVAKIGKYAFEGCVMLNDEAIELKKCPEFGENCFSFGTADANVSVLFLIPEESAISLFDDTHDENTTLSFNRGTCGDGCSFYYNLDSYTLNIMCVENGTGAMTDYSTDNPAPWGVVRLLIETVNISPAITHIGDYAFYGCENVTSVNFPTTIGATSLESIGKHAFDSCYRLGSLNISFVKTIDDFAFANCGYSGIMDLTYVETIGNSAFMKCTGITKIILENVVTIGEKAFMLCGIKDILTIPKSTTSIGNYAFYQCNGLSGGKIIFEGGFVEIGVYAFALGTPESLEAKVTLVSDGWANAENIPEKVFGLFTEPTFDTGPEETKSDNTMFYIMGAIVLLLIVVITVLLYKMGIISFKREKKPAKKETGGDK